MGLNQIKVELIRSWGGDDNIAHAAWASSYDKSKADAKTPEDVRKVVEGIVRNSHGTPKESVWVEFFITCPIFCERQLDKYRMTLQHQDIQVEMLERPMGGLNITQNELSGRYRTIPDRGYDMPTDVETICKKAYSTADYYNWKEDWQMFISDQHKEYSLRLQILKMAEKSGKITNAEYKRAREVWRGLLGTHTLTDMRMTMNLNAFEHIVNQRLDPASQLETRVVAALMLDAMLAAGVAPTALSEMAIKNNWLTWYMEVSEALNKTVVDNSSEKDAVSKLSDAFWLKVLEDSTQLGDGIPNPDLRQVLTKGGMAPTVIDAYLVGRMWFGRRD